MTCFETDLQCANTAPEISGFHNEIYGFNPLSIKVSNAETQFANSKFIAENQIASSHDHVSETQDADEFPLSPSELMMRKAKEEFERDVDKKQAATRLAPTFEEAIKLADREWRESAQRIDPELKKLESQNGQDAKDRRDQLQIELDTAVGTRLVVRTGYADVLDQVGEKTRAEQLRKEAWDIGLEATFGPKD